MAETPTTSAAALLRRVADIIELHPDLPLPMVTSYTSGKVEVDWFIDRHENQRALMRQIRQALGGIWDKVHGASYFHLRQEHGDLRLSILTDREQVCERVVVGTEIVTIPAVEAQPERTEAREIVEWRCEPVTAEAVSR